VTKRVARWSVWVAAATVAVAGVGSAGAAPPERDGGLRSWDPPSQRATGHTVTLITGDVVRVEPGAPGREQVRLVGRSGTSSNSVHVVRQANRTYVIPAMARPYVLAGKLDSGLFDVTTLVADGFADRQRKRIPLIMTYAGAPGAASAKARSDSWEGARRVRVLSSIGAAAVEADKRSAREFWESIDDDRAVARRNAASVRLAGGISHVWLDRPVKASLAESVPQIGAPAAWEKGLTGKGVTVAIADTGVDDTHPDLKGKVAASADFSDSADTVDRVGHGTHVASTVAGDGAASDGRYTGVAPDARLVSAKVLDDSGAGWWSDVIAGMEWSVDQGADVVNLSLGGMDTPEVDPVEEAINRLTRQTGTLFVTAAGNQPACTGGNRVGSPATADEALAVGAVDKTDGFADFSCVGPRLGDGAIKPEITAPGVDIVAARASGTEVGEPVGEHYVTASGTSMATPHVAGAAAILLQQHPSWTPGELRARLMSTARENDAVGVFQQGAGRIDVAHATSSEVRTSAGKLELGYFRWPHDELTPVTKELTYSNDSDAAVALDLSIEASGAEPVPAGALSLDQKSVTVSANGTATVTVRLDPSALASGNYGGVLTAAVAGTDKSLRTPVGWYNEPEMYDLTVEGINHNGTPMAEILDVVDIDDGAWTPIDLLVIQNGRTTLRLPPGHYSVGATVATDPSDDAPGEFVVVTQPDVDLRQDTTAVLDGRKAKEVTVDVKGAPRTTLRSTTVGYTRSSETPGPGGYGGSAYSAHVSNRRMYAVPTSPVRLGEFEFVSHVRREAPPITIKAAGAQDLDLDPRFYPVGPRFDGRWRFPLAAFPDGGPVEGAVALIARDMEVSSGEQAFAAQQAGAKAVLFYDPDTPGRTGEWWSTSEEPLDVQIPGIAISRTAAKELQALLGQGEVTLDVTAIDPSPYIYDLAVPVDGRIPDVLRFSVDRRDLARLDVQFGTHGERQPDTSEDRSGLTPAGADVSGFLIPHLAAPYKRTDYVLANKVSWSQIYSPNNRGGDAPFYSELHRTYQPGERQVVRWMGPAATHSLPAGEAILGGLVERTDTGLRAAVDAFVDRKDRTDESYSDAHQMRLLRDGQLVGESSDRYGEFELPDGPATLRLELESARSYAWWKYSTGISSAWTVQSTGEGTDDEPERLPLLLVDYDVAQADLSNRVPSGRPVELELEVRHQNGATASPIDTVELDLSYDDGATWQSVPMDPTGGGIYTALLEHPSNHAGGAVTLRVDVQDEAGSRLQQTVTRAYGIR
jgi:subtilisin family serine protease